MMRKIIKIKGKEYQFELKDGAWAGDNGATVVGETQYYPRKIIVANKNDVDETIIHELTHAFLHECGVDSLDNEMLARWLERQFFDIWEAWLEAKTVALKKTKLKKIGGKINAKNQEQAEIRE